jgi:hypothetical protein
MFTERLPRNDGHRHLISRRSSRGGGLRATLGTARGRGPSRIGRRVLHEQKKWSSCSFFSF